MRVTNENVILSEGVLPLSRNAAAVDGNYISLKQGQHCTFIIITGAMAGADTSVTINQATAVAGTSEKAVSFSWMWTNDGATATSVLTKTAVTSNTFDLDVANAMYVIEIDADMLDVDNGFDCIQLALGASTGADTVGSIQMVSEARFMNAADVMVD